VGRHHPLDNIDEASKLQEGLTPRSNNGEPSPAKPGRAVSTTNTKQKNLSTSVGRKNIPITVPSSSLENPLRNFEAAKFASKTHGLIISYAANTHQGIQRSYNEDRVSIILNMTRPLTKKISSVEWPKCSYFAIYDGHGGSACADFLKECLHTIIINQDCFPSNPA